MAFWDEVTLYYWNWVVWLHNSTAMYWCWKVGGWGLFWDDDDGWMTDLCMNMVGGSNVQYPVYYWSKYSDAPEE